MSYRSWLVAASALLPLLLGACASSVPLKGGWRDQALSVDGDPSEWSGLLAPMEDARFSVGVQHDDERLYFCLVSADPGVQAQILGAGLELWINSSGEREKTFGFRYPIGAMERADGGEPRSPREGDSRPSRMREPDREDRRARLEERLAAQSDELRLLSSRHEGGWTLPVADLQGVQLALALDGPRLVYELSVDWNAQEGGDFGLGAKPDGELYLCVDSPDEGLRPGRGQGPGGGMGMGPGGMAGSPFGDRPPRRDSDSRPKPFEIWLKVDLEASR